MPPDLNANLQTELSSATRTFLLRQHKLFIGGEWVHPKQGETRPIFDPARGEQISTSSESGPDDVDRAVAAARAAFESGAWPAMSASERGRILWRFADLVDKHSEELSQLDTLNQGSPYQVVRDYYLPATADQLRYFAGWTTKINGETIPLSAPGNWHAYTIRQPIGVVGQIIPWNVPALMVAWKVAPALAAGCTVVLKPAEHTPLSALRLAELAHEAGLPKGVLNVVTGDGRAGEALVNHRGVDKIAFTGSTAVGKRLLQLAAGNLKKLSLELGGKSPAIVLSDANVEHTVSGLLAATFLNSGQACTNPSIIKIHTRIYDQVVGELVKRATAMSIGHGLHSKTEVGPLISQRQLDRVIGYIDRAIADGGRVLTGGKRFGNVGYFVEPTILEDVPTTSAAYCEEIFGPVTCVQRFDDDTDLDALAAQANESSFGLSASIWTNDISKAHKLASKLGVGVVWINAHHQIDAALPFGGVKESGWGREMGFQAIELYTEVKSVATRLLP